ncbi:MAG: hypothetical protein AAFO03_01995 [Bacteroidota bacterium]
MKHIILISIFVYGGLGLWQSAIAQVFRYDFGAAETPEYITINQTGGAANWTWTAPPSRSFRTTRGHYWQPPAWHDGVVAPSLAWQGQVEAGTYELQLFLNTGLELNSTWRIRINGEEYPLDLYPTRNAPEPLEKPAAHVKIWRGQFKATNTYTVELTGGADSIRLLAAHLFSVTEAKLEREHWLVKMLGQYGTFHPKPIPLEPVLDNLTSALAREPDNAYYFKHLHEARWVDWAEQFIDLRGWQWSTNLYGLSMIQKFEQAVMLLNPILRQPQHPLYERALWNAGRLLFHLDHEYHSPPDSASAQHYLRILRNRYPQDTLLRMYTYEYFPNPDDSQLVDKRAPEWSQLQLIGLHRMRKLVHYWVQERQAPNGELGGKYGDDVEALRFWHPLFYTGDSLAILGLQRMADGVWYSDEVEDGFAAQVADVEHASEFISDTAPTIIAASDDSVRHARALATARHMRERWTQRDPNGSLHFRGAWYSSSEVDERSPRNRDHAYNTRTAKVLRYYLWRYPEAEEVRDLLYDWSKSWARLAARTDKQKPAGVLPVSYRAEDGAINGDEPNWFRANMYWRFFEYKGGVQMLDQLLFVSQYVDDDSLLYPVETALALVDRYRSSGGEPGTAAWVANILWQRDGFWKMAAQWRLLTGNTSYDALLRENGPAYFRYRLTGQVDKLLAELRHFNAGLGYNWPMQTENTWFTDRILAQDSTAFRRMNTDVLRAMLTGDMSANGTSPYLAVTYEGVQPGFTALVNETEADRLVIEFYNHTDKPQQVVLRPWQLAAGAYQVRQGDTLLHRAWKASQAGERLEITLAARAGSVVQITP